MNTLLNALRPIMNSRTAKVALEVSAHPTDPEQMVVIAKPVVGQVSAKAPQELQLLCAHLATPIKIIGKPEDIESALAETVSQQEAHRTSWAERAAQIEAELNEAAKSGKTTNKKPAPKTEKPETKTPDVDLIAPEDTDQDAPSVGGFSL